MTQDEGQLHSPKLTEDAEERLHPSRYLGYDRDRLGIALLRREMFEAAESQFRRAAYLNPFEAAFRQHLAWCLYRMDRIEEAYEAIEEALRLDPNDPDAPVAREKILQKLSAAREPGGAEPTA